MVKVDFGGIVMSFRLIEKDFMTLGHIADYRMLTVSQIAAIFHKNKQAVRRRLREAFQSAAGKRDRYGEARETKKRRAAENGHEPGRRGRGKEKTRKTPAEKGRKK